MQAKDAIRQSIEMADFTMGKYLDDLDDAAFMKRPVAGMNTIAWQVGHLISSEREAIEGIKPGSCPPLPEGFDAPFEDVEFDTSPELEAGKSTDEAKPDEETPEKETERAERR